MNNDGLPSNEQHNTESLDSSEVDEQWANLTQDWQTQSTIMTDIAALVKRTRRKTYLEKIFFTFDIIATLGLLTTFLYGFYDGQWGDNIQIYLGFGSLLSIIFVYFETKIRIATWSKLCDSPDKAIDNAITSHAASIKYMLITKIAFLPFLLLVNWFVYTLGQASDKAQLPPFLMVNVFFLVIYLVLEYLHRKRKQEHHQLQAMK